MSIVCPKCGNTKVTKSGFSRKKQRYLCKPCNWFHFVPRGDKDQLVSDLKQKQVRIAYLAGAQIKKIEDIFDVSYPTVIKLLGPLHNDQITYKMSPEQIEQTITLLRSL